MMNHSQPTGADYNYTVVRQFALTTVLWGIIGMSLGVLIAAQLIWPQLNFETPWLTFSRLRPLHTNAVIFAFGTSAFSPHPIMSFNAPVRPVCLHLNCCIHLLGMASHHSLGRNHSAAGYHQQ